MTTAVGKFEIKDWKEGPYLEFGDGRKLTRASVAQTFLGDIAISPASARRNAKSSGHSLATELRILMLHGVLHLLGYDHETDSGQMHRLEQNLRQRLGLA